VRGDVPHRGTFVSSIRSPTIAARRDKQHEQVSDGRLDATQFRQVAKTSHRDPHDIGSGPLGSTVRIAQVAPLAESVPPSLYGGTERIVSYLTEELVALGHEVTLFASGDSHTRAILHAGSPRALRSDSSCRDPLAWHIAMLEQVAQAAPNFDIIHFHLDWLHFPAFRRQQVPFEIGRAS
jgi:hypothetical protein